MLLILFKYEECTSRFVLVEYEVGLQMWMLYMYGWLYACFRCLRCCECGVVGIGDEFGGGV